jgi:hypothetical protein
MLCSTQRSGNVLTFSVISSQHPGTLLFSGCGTNIRTTSEALFRLSKPPPYTKNAPCLSPKSQNKPKGARTVETYKFLSALQTHIRSRSLSSAFFAQSDCLNFILRRPSQQVHTAMSPNACIPTLPATALDITTMEYVKLLPSDFINPRSELMFTQKLSRCILP